MGVKVEEDGESEEDEEEVMSRERLLQDMSVDRERGGRGCGRGGRVGTVSSWTMAQIWRDSLGSGTNMVIQVDKQHSNCNILSNSVCPSRLDKSGRTQISGYLGIIARITPEFL